MNHHKLFGSGLTAVNEVRRRAVFFLEDIVVFFYLLMVRVNNVFGVKFLVPVRFLMNIFCSKFLHDEFHVKVRQRIP